MSQVPIFIKNPVNDLACLKLLLHPGIYDNLVTRVINLENAPFYFSQKIEAY